MEEKRKITELLKEKSKLQKIIIALSIILIIVILIFILFAHRSAKATVKDVGKVVKNTDIIGAVDLVDPIGITAFVLSYDYEEEEIDFDKYDEKYQKIEEIYKKVKKELKKGKYTIKVTDTKKEADCKSITKVTCDIKIKYEKKEIEFKDIKVYTMKDGLKNRIVGISPESIYDLEDQIEDQYDEIEDIGEDLEDILKDIEDLVD